LPIEIGGVKKEKGKGVERRLLGKKDGNSPAMGEDYSNRQNGK